MEDDDDDDAEAGVDRPAKAVMKKKNIKKSILLIIGYFPS
jgi:hypothetical protein